MYGYISHFGRLMRKLVGGIFFRAPGIQGVKNWVLGQNLALLVIFRKIPEFKIFHTFFKTQFQSWSFYRKSMNFFYFVRFCTRSSNLMLFSHFCSRNHFIFRKMSSIFRKNFKFFWKVTKNSTFWKIKSCKIKNK